MKKWWKSSRKIRERTIKYKIEIKLPYIVDWRLSLRTYDEWADPKARIVYSVHLLILNSSLSIIGNLQSLLVYYEDDKFYDKEAKLVNISASNIDSVTKQIKEALGE